jgi:hypothetical protein
MAVITILPKRREVPPTLLDRTVCLEIRDEEVEELLYIRR